MIHQRLSRASIPRSRTRKCQARTLRPDRGLGRRMFGSRRRRRPRGRGRNTTTSRHTRRFPRCYWNLSACDNRILGRREAAGRVENTTSAVRRVENQGGRGSKKANSGNRARNRGPPHPRLDPPVKHPGWHGRCCRLPGAPGPGAGSRGSFIWL